jgi:hypothetical protein
MATVTQEFYCNDCDGYFRVPLNMALNIDVLMTCPNCGRKHERSIEKGVLFERWGSGDRKYVEEIAVPKTAYSKKPIHKLSRQHMRGGVVIADPSRDLIEDRWREIYGGRI